MREKVFWGSLIFIFLWRFLTFPFPQKFVGKTVVVRGCFWNSPGEKRQFSFRGFWIRPLRPLEIALGDCLVVKGKATVKEGKVWLENPKIVFRERKRSFLLELKDFALWCQARAGAIFQKFLPEPEASLLAGIVLGKKSSLPRELFEALKNTGSLHIVVASGYNLTVISRWPVEFLAWFVGRKLALLLGGVLVWFYSLVAGGEPPVIRAAIMISLVYLAQALGEKLNPWRGWVFAGWLMLLVNPLLLFNISFQLSMAAMGGILFFEKKLERLRKIPLVGKELADSLAAQLAVFPLLGWHFGRVSWAAPLINMIILPLVPTLMSLGIAALGGLVFPWLGLPFLWLAYPFAWIIVQIVSHFGQFSWLTVKFSFPWWLVVIYYLGGVYWWRKRN